MNLSKHAKKRQQQRGISNQVIDIVLEHGKALSAPGGVEKVFFGNKEFSQVICEFKKAIRMIERAKGGTLIIKDDRIITVYKK